MQRSKALLDAGGITFLERAIGALRDAGCDTVHAVVAADDEAAAACAETAGAIVVRNPEPRSEPVDSVRIGLRASGDAAAVVVLPVDAPLVRAETVIALLSAFRERQPALAVPVAAGRQGHPLILSCRLFGEVLMRDLPDGLHTLLVDHADALLEVAVLDGAVHDDIDTPGDYERVFGTSPGKLAAPDTRRPAGGQDG